MQIGRPSLQIHGQPTSIGQAGTKANRGARHSNCNDGH